MSDINDKKRKETSEITVDWLKNSEVSSMGYYTFGQIKQAFYQPQSENVGQILNDCGREVEQNES